MVYSGNSAVGFGGGQQDYALAVDQNGNPHITYAESDFGNWEIHYTYWNGSVWTTSKVSNISNTLGNSRSPCIALDQNDLPYIAWVEIPVNSPLKKFWNQYRWKEFASGSQIHLIHWNGTEWVTLGGNTNVSRTSGSAWSPSLAIDSSGNPYLAWEDDSEGNSEIYYQEWTGSVWTTKTKTHNVSKTPGAHHLHVCA